MSPEQKLKRVIEETGATLVRQKNHLIYRLPNGRIVSVAKTGSDWRGIDASIRDFRRMSRFPAVENKAS